MPVENAVPQLSFGVELLGELEGSGYLEGTYLVRTVNGTTIQMSRLLYEVLANIDGTRDLDEVAARVSMQFGRHLSTEKLAYLIEDKLRQLSLLAQDIDPAPSRPRSRPLTVSATIVPRRFVHAATRMLRPLFFMPVVVSVLSALAVFDGWLILGPGTGDGMHQIIQRPGLLLGLAALTGLAGGFHELGHATACHYGGAEPGAIGVGICVIWPVFYNDLNDSYRLGRSGRIRADLGGVYFNAVLILALAAAYATTGFRPILVVIILHHLLAVQQLLPVKRLDGYYVVCDLAGVPDLSAQAQSMVANLMSGRHAPTPAKLTLKARVIVAAWLLATATLLIGGGAFMAPRLPGYLRLAKVSTVAQMGALSTALRDGAGPAIFVSGLQLAILAVPVVGIAVMVTRAVLSHTGHGPRQVPDRGPSPPLVAFDDGTQAAARQELEQMLVRNSGYTRLPAVLDALGCSRTP